MKILKIELQNLNSLKSDKPIIIDFESEKFQNVGLYAITGSTGAGKTTILDAITVALYHNVPRFNKSHIKANLSDIISYGAADAMSRVTFENQGTRYEAYWGMRLQSKTGKIIKTPEETVRLKNLKTEKILAEKKREFISEIEKITQLNYDQFLRSAMLAQGEFAAFLSANAKEKGTLLEQITGEEIYKKIGETTSNRINQENKVLNTITAKINDQDILSAEDKKALKRQKSHTKKIIKQQNNELKQLEKIYSWHKKQADLQQQKQELILNQQKLKQEQEKSRITLVALERHNKAEPFKNILSNINRIKQEIIEKQSKETTLKQSLIIINKDLKIAADNKELDTQKLKSQEVEAQLWQTKLYEVTKLDTQLFNLQEAKTKTSQKLIQLTTSTETLKAILKTKNQQTNNQHSQLKDIEQFIQQNQAIKIIEKQLNSWSTALVLRKSNLDNIQDIQFKIKQLKQGQQQDNKNLDTSKQELQTQQKSHAVNQAELDKLSNQLKTLDITQQLKQQKQLNQQKQQLKNSLDLATNNAKYNNNESILNKEKAELETVRNNLGIEHSVIQDNVTTVAESLKDAKKIYDLERNIVNFKQQRNKLKPEQDCPLCGSKQHPYVGQYMEINLTESESKIKNLTAKTNSLSGQLNQLAIKIATTRQQLENNANAINKLKQEIQKTSKEFNQLKSKFTIQQITDIAQELNQILTQFKQTTSKIEQANILQSQKNQHEIQLNTQQQSLNHLQNQITRQQEKTNGDIKILKQLNQELDKLISKSQRTEQQLSTELKTGELSLPTAAETDKFIKNLNRQINTYQQKLKDQTAIENHISQLKIDVKHQTNKLTETTSLKQEQDKEQAKILQSLDDYQNKRTRILPANTSPQQKRQELQGIAERIKYKLDKTSKLYNQLVTKKATKEKEQSNLINAITEQQKEFNTIQASFTQKMHSSDFNTQQEIQRALLDEGNIKSYTKLKNQLHTTSIELATKQQQITEALDTQKDQKDFKIDLQQLIKDKTELQTKKDETLKKIGEIKKQLELDRQIKNRNKTVYQEIDQQQQILQKYKDLYNLLGNSKHAFNAYVQRLTLHNLIIMANIHLQKLQPRYSLKMNQTYKAGEELNFNLVDHFQTDQTRLVDTSSGGEKFLISLALALGLSDLASSSVKIESLFIDEGFGTLDNNTLEIVIATLETLQAQGKMIGIISHVENLKERITTQIQITKKSNGISVVEVV